jgi:NAD(P)H-dependent FMN reductase
MKAMKIVVLNGSPKGMTSVTMQYVRFLQKGFPQHAFTIFIVCQNIKKFEGDQTVWREVIEAGDVVLWATPVYVFLVPGPYKRFIELVIERGTQAAFKGKYAAILTTSVPVTKNVTKEPTDGTAKSRCSAHGRRRHGKPAAAVAGTPRQREGEGR